MSKEPIGRSFSSPEDLVKQAKRDYEGEQSILNKIEYDAGFDVKDINSVMAFDPGFTPIGNTVLLKQIPTEIKSAGNLSIIDNSLEGKLFYVITTGLLVRNLHKGDIVTLSATVSGGVSSVRKIFKKVTLWEVDYYSISGIFMAKEELEERIAKDDLAIKLKLAREEIIFQKNKSLTNADTI
jgi:hypothetical protein